LTMQLNNLPSPVQPACHRQAEVHAWCGAGLCLLPHHLRPVAPDRQAGQSDILSHQV